MTQTLKINKYPDDIDIMRSEATRLWELHHISLPTLKEYADLGGGRCAVIMSYVYGHPIDSIFDKMKAKGMTGIDQYHVCSMMQRTLPALGFLHSRGIVHGDVKPQNIMVSPETRNATLVDFGFALKKPKKESQPFGFTPFFSPPEIIRYCSDPTVTGYAPPIPETDIYSLGVTALYAMGGDLPTLAFPSIVDQRIANFFRRFIVRNPLDRPKDAYQLERELIAIRKEVFGDPVPYRELII